MGNLISERGVMEKSQEKFKGLRYSIGENAEDLLSKFGKYMTTILNDGGGGVIILKIWANIDVLVDQIKQEIGKITPRVQDSEYKISSKRRNGDIGEIKIDVEPVPWGFEAYAAADGNIYTPETADHATDENQMDFQFEYTEPKMNTKMKPTVEIGEMQTHSDCELGDIRQEKTDKNTGAPPSDIKEIIDDCVNDLRDIKAKLGISNRLDQAEKVDTKKITSDVETFIISLSEEELNHRKSLSEILSDVVNRRPILQRKFGSLTGDVDHRESDSEYVLPQLDGMYDEDFIQTEELDPYYAANDTSEFKTLCEDFEFNQCKDLNSFPTTTENRIQVDGDGCVGDIEHRGPVLVHALDGIYVIKSHLKETIRREHINYYAEELILAEKIRREHINYSKIIDFMWNGILNQYEEDIYAGIERDDRIVIGNILVDNKNNNEYKSNNLKRESMNRTTATKLKYIHRDLVWRNDLDFMKNISSYPRSWWTHYAKKRNARIERNFKIVLANISDIMSGRVDNKKNNAYKSNLSFDFVAQKEKRMDEIRLSCFYVSILLRSLNDKQEKRLATGNVLSFSKMSPNLFDELVEKLGKIMWEDQIHIPMQRPIDIRLQQIDQWIQVETEIQRIQNRGRTFKDRIGFICGDYCDRYQQRLFGYTPIGLIKIDREIRDLVDKLYTARRKKKQFLSSDRNVLFFTKMSPNLLDELVKTFKKEIKIDREIQDLVDKLYTARRKKKQFLSSDRNILSFTKMSPNLLDELVKKFRKIVCEDQIHIPMPRPIDIRLQQFNQWIQVENEIQRIENRGRNFENRIGCICSDYCDRYQQRGVRYTSFSLIESKTRDLVDIHLTARRKKKEYLSSSVASVGSCNSNEGCPERKVQVPHTEFTRKFQYVRIQITKTNQWERIMTNELAGKEDRDLYNTEECISMVPDTHFKTTQVVSKVRTLIPIAFPITYQFGFTVTTEPGCLVIV